MSVKLTLKSGKVNEMIKLLNLYFSASNSVAVSGLGIRFQVILKKKMVKKENHIPHL